jgi:flavin reductase (DIM6/NTAB) family NADH-FMN oxidoreductase RutF
MTAQDPTMERFHPSPDTGRKLRDALGRYATGVTVVTVSTPSGPVGMTVNSFTSVSLDPALVLWCPARSSSRFDAFATAPTYAIHVLASDQLDLSLRFARSGGNFDGLSPPLTPDGHPALAGVLARFDCRAHAIHDGGDHAVLIAEVKAVEARLGDPLLFWGGRYGDFLHHA